MATQSRTGVTVHSSSIDGPTRTVRCGDVIVVGPELTPEQRAMNALQNIRHSDGISARLRASAQTPPAWNIRRPSISLYYANKGRPGTVIHEKDGEVEVGTLLKDGTFQKL
ncbi:hypothetical protein ACFQY5_33990 [Paeniroseomonas aquatica]|uniref:Uncharacterized protein n=1 Tax=Paeniroseomonas aquatica TaxID=373043 RepID=A0ABT8A3N6_9PROT|nr:hypothetical protein [Paeniroseomonas aquatica]MDN3564350.1 hypothetical protein [Paeniroseomonas aquatica]